MMISKTWRASRSRSTALVIGFATLAGPAPASAQSLSQCETIVGIHRMMLDIKDECRLRLRDDTSDLAYQCITRFSSNDSNKIIQNSRAIQAEIRKEHGRNFCRFIRKEFGPLIR